MFDPKSDKERQDLAERCAATLVLDVPMVVDGVDDAVNMAYSAWPERLYVLKPDGTIHYRGDLGPRGFDPQEAADAVAELLGEESPDLEEFRERQREEEDAAAGADDGFSGLWAGSGTGRIMEGNIPIRLRLALGADGVVGGRVEVTSARYPLPLREARFDAKTGALTAKVSIQGRPVALTGSVREQSLSARLIGPDDMELMSFDAKRVQKGPPLEPGLEDPTGAWAGAAIATDPALAGKSVRIELTEASSTTVAGAVTLDGRTATIEKGRYDAQTGTFLCQARVEGGPTMRVEAAFTAGGATGRITMAPALVVAFTAQREPESPR